MSTTLSLVSVFPTTALFPGKPFDVAVSQAQRLQGLLFTQGHFSSREIQLCPQTKEHTSLRALEALQADHPETRFSLHANVKRGVAFEPFDASVDFSDPWVSSYVAWLKNACDVLDAPRYSWHASGGTRANTLASALENTQRLQDALQRPVALEGLYPSPYGWALGTVSEYEQLLESPIDFVLDLSHLYICHCQDRPVDDALISALLSHPNCAEIHLSHNDGTADRHCDFPPGVVPFGWETLLSLASNSSFLQPAVFIESRLR